MNMGWCPENLAMVDNTIAKKQNGSFSPCGSTIITLNLRNAGIMVIQDSAFDEFSKILTLDLRDNKVKEIQENIFNPLKTKRMFYARTRCVPRCKHSPLQL
jgi:uncharacterized membrane protein